MKAYLMLHWLQLYYWVKNLVQGIQADEDENGTMDVYHNENNKRLLKMC